MLEWGWHLTFHCETVFLQQITSWLYSKEGEINAQKYLQIQFDINLKDCRGFLLFSFLIIHYNHPAAYDYHSKWQQALCPAAQCYALHTGSKLMAVQQKVKEMTFRFPFDISYISAFPYHPCQNILAFEKLLILSEEDSSRFLWTFRNCGSRMVWAASSICSCFTDRWLLW